MPTWASLVHTTFGIVLMIKVGLFLVMLFIAVLVNTYIHRHLKRDADQAAQAPAPAAGHPDWPHTHLIYDGQAYDVSHSKLWPGGEHMRRHQAGEDLTEAMAAAPHGPEVLERLPKLGAGWPPAEAKAGPELGPTARLLVVLSYVVLGAMVGVLLCLALVELGAAPWPTRPSPLGPTRPGPAWSATRRPPPGIYADWGALAPRLGQGELFALPPGRGRRPGRGPGPLQGLRQGRRPLGPGTLSRAHQRGGHAPRTAPGATRTRPSSTPGANTPPPSRSSGPSIPWLNHGLNSGLERATGCFHCHGTVLKVGADGRLDPLTWPNVGVGRLNLDGSWGSCAACHTPAPLLPGRGAPARDLPASAIWGRITPKRRSTPSPSTGAIYRSAGTTWNFEAAPGAWTAGVDYRAPTCAACHMSGSGGVLTTHDAGERLSWELQAPLTIRPGEFKPWPSPVPWTKARAAMQAVCLQCHGQAWGAKPLRPAGRSGQGLQPGSYYLPSKAKLDQLYAKGLLPPGALFQSPLWVEFYELWHHEGRRARMGTAMMAPDYAWWHGLLRVQEALREVPPGGGPPADGRQEGVRGSLFPARPRAAAPHRLQSRGRCDEPGALRGFAARPSRRARSTSAGARPCAPSAALTCA